MITTVKFIMPFKNIKTGDVVNLTERNARDMIAKGYAEVFMASTDDFETKESPKKKEPKE